MKINIAQFFEEIVQYIEKRHQLQDYKNNINILVYESDEKGKNPSYIISTYRTYTHKPLKEKITNNNTRVVLYKYEDSINLTEQYCTYYLESELCNIDNIKKSYNNIHKYIIQNNLHITEKNFAMLPLNEDCNDAIINLNSWQYIYSYIDDNGK
jgi:hypothetical protein